MIDVAPDNSPYNWQEPTNDEENYETAKSDLERLFKKMPTPRYAYVIRKLLIEDWEPERLAMGMNITTANLYNIKLRAIAQLTRVALNDIKEYGK